MDPYDSASEKVSILGPTLVFKGELSADEDLMLKGRVEGSIRHTANLRIGAEGSVKGNIDAKNITVHGTVDGDLHGRECVTVREAAKVTGNIFAPRITLVEGACFNGKVDMDAAGAASGAAADVKGAAASEAVGKKAAKVASGGA